MLILNIFADQIRGHFVPHRPHKIPIAPKLPRPKLLLQPRKLLKHYLRAYTLQYLYNLCRRIFGWCRKKYVNMINLDPHCVNLKIILPRYLSKQLLYPLLQLFRQNMFPVLWNPHEMIFDVIDCMSSPFDRHAATISHFSCLRHEGFDPRPYRRGIPPYFL